MHAQGNRGGVVVRALAFHHCGLGSIPGPSIICAWVEFIVGSQPCSEGFFSGDSSFPPSTKSNISKFQFHPEAVEVRATL